MIPIYVVGYKLDILFIVLSNSLSYIFNNSFSLNSSFMICYLVSNSTIYLVIVLITSSFLISGIIVVGRKIVLF